MRLLDRDPTLEIILVEQDASRQIDGVAQPNLKHIFVENSGSFNKSWGLNIAASHASCGRLLFADADMLMSAASLNAITEAMNQGIDAVNPYDVLIDLSQQETQQLLEQSADLNISRSTEDLNRKSLGQHPPFCGGVFAITRTLYQLTGGMDERFEGWGGEDDAMSKRVTFFSSTMTTLSSTAYHLWHEDDEHVTNHTSAYIRNLALLTQYYERQETFYQLLAKRDLLHNSTDSKYQSLAEGSNCLDEHPLVSCLCVTRGRIDPLTRAIECFQRQTITNKELIVICEADDEETIDLLTKLTIENVRFHIASTEPKQSLGELRNLSIEKANGEFICQWDDDDWYHPERLSKQLNSALAHNKAASILARWLIYHQQTDTIYCSNIRLWEGSLLCRKNTLPLNLAYDNKHRGEDSKVVQQLYIDDQLAIEDLPDLYVYHLHSHNTWHNEHSDKIIESSIKLSSEEATKIKKRIAAPDDP